MANVYVVNDAGHDIHNAVSFGSIVYLTKDKVNIFSVDRIKRDFEEKLKSFDPANDYVLISGAIILNIIAVTVLRDLGVKSISILVFNFNTKMYMVRSV